VSLNTFRKRKRKKVTFDREYMHLYSACIVV